MKIKLLKSLPGFCVIRPVDRMDRQPFGCVPVIGNGLSRGLPDVNPDMIRFQGAAESGITQRWELGVSHLSDGPGNPDQISITEENPTGKIRLLIDILDDASPPNDIFIHVAHPEMESSGSQIPSTIRSEKLPATDRPTVVVDMILNEDGTLQDSVVYQVRILDTARLKDSLLAARGELQ